MNGILTNEKCVWDPRIRKTKQIKIIKQIECTKLNRALDQHRQYSIAVLLKPHIRKIATFQESPNKQDAKTNGSMDVFLLGVSDGVTSFCDIFLTEICHLNRYIHFRNCLNIEVII